MRTPFLGPYSVSRSTNLADNQLINLYPELVEGHNSKDAGALFLVPGLQLVLTVGYGPIWGMRVFAGALFVVSGSNLYAVTSTLTVTNLGNIAASGPVTMVDNGVQLGIFTPGLWVYALGSTGVVPVPLPFTPLGAAVLLDGFIIAAQAGPQPLNSETIWQSNLLDMTVWQGLTFASATGNSDPIIALYEMNREIFIFKRTVTEVWVNQQTGGFSFGRLEGVYIETGCIAPHSIAQLGDTIMFLTQNLQGSGVVMQLKGYTPLQISSHGIESVLQDYGKMDDAIGYTYQQDGHYFYVLSLPSGDATWVYDSTTSHKAKEPMWHRRTAFANGQHHRHPGQVQAFFANQNLIGDSASGNLYTYQPGLGLDNGQQRKWVRSWRALPRPSEQPMRFSSLRIDMQTGIGVPDGTDPLVVLRYSDDGGHNWSRERFAHAGKPGESALRVKFNRLGSTRRNSGLDRIFELSSTDVFPAALIGAELE